MAGEAFIVLCVQTFLIQSALSIGPIEPFCVPAVCGFNGLSSCVAPFVPAVANGGSFVVTSSSPVAPTGVTIVSENVYEGALCAGGNLPLLGSVGVEGEFSTAGAGAVSYGCGDDDLAIVAEQGPVTTGIVAPTLAVARGFAPFFGGYGLGFGRGFGYRGFGYGSGIFGRGFGGCGCYI